MREINDFKYKRDKNEMDDFIINGELSIEELYFLAKRDGFEKNKFFFKIREKDRGIDTIYSSKVVSFGRGWTKGSVIFEIEHELDKYIGENCG
jgi:hypothetical protein